MRNSKRAKIEKNKQFKNRDNNIDFMKIPHYYNKNIIYPMSYN